MTELYQQRHFPVVETFPMVTRPQLEFPGLSDLARNTFCVKATGAANERMFNIDGHAMNSRGANSKTSSVNDILFFNSALRKIEALNFDEVLRFYISVIFKTFRWLRKEPLNKLQLAMKHIA